MKKVMLIISLLLLSGCINVGDFPERRERMHTYGKEDGYCQQHPDKCYMGVPW